MIRFLALTARKDVRVLLRDPFGLLVWLGIPLGIGLMISLAFGGGGGGRTPQAHVLVVDEDQSFLSELLLGALGRQKGEGLFLVEAVEAEEGRERIDAGDATALLVVPDGFAEALLKETPCTLELVTNPAQTLLPQMVEETLQVLVDGTFYLHRVFGGPLKELVVEPPEGQTVLPNETIASASVAINGIVERLQEMLAPPVLDVEFAAEEGEDEDGLSLGELFFPSMLFMTLFFLAGGLAESVWREKDQGTLRRVLASPNRPAAFLAGKVLGAVGVMAVVSLLAFLLGRYVFGFPLENLPLGVVWAAFSGGFLLMLMFLVQLHASSQRAGGLLANVVTMPLLMLGGSFFPFEVMPDWMAALGKRTPNGWALEVLKEILGGHAGASAVLTAGAALVSVELAMLWIAARRMAGKFARA